MGTLSFLEYIWMGVLSTIIITPVKLFGWWGVSQITKPIVYSATKFQKQKEQNVNRCSNART